MALGIGFGLERIALAALRFPKAVTACIFSLLVLIGVSLPGLRFDDNINRVFMSDSALSDAQRAYEQQQAPPLSTLLVHVTSADPFDAEDMTRLRDLSLDLEFIDGVNAVASPFVLRGPPEPDAPDGKPVFGPQITSDYANAVDAFDALETGLPTFLNGAMTAMLLSVSIDTDQASVGNAMAAIRDMLDSGLPARFAAHITGEDAISAEIVTGLKDDLVSLNLLGALIIAGAALVLLRDVRMAVLAVVPALFGAAGVMALSVWLGYPITVLSNVIPILLLVLGVADGVHLAGHLKDHGCVREAVITVGPACALTALTTAVAFASVALSGNAQLFEFAVLGSVGAMLSFAMIIVSFALLGRLMVLSDRPLPRFSTSLARRITAVGAARARLTVAGCLLVLAIATGAFSQTKAWFPLYQNLPDNSPTLATNDAIAKDFGGVFQMVVETDGEWTRTKAIAETLEQLSPPRTVLSEVNFARWLGHPDAPPTATERKRLPQALARQFGSQDGPSRIFVSVPEPMRDAASLVQFDRVYDAAIKAGAERVIGLPTIMRHEAVRLINQLSSGLILAALGATLLVALAFRSMRLVPVLILPNVLPLVLTGASLHLWAQGQLTPTAVLSLTIAFGIAIDDTVHFLSRFSGARARGASTAEAVKQAATSAGGVMVTTTVLLTAGLCVTLFSDFGPIRLFGGLMIVTLWAALLIDLLLLPALLTWRAPRHAHD